jgi:uncharacterized protein YjbI with pentapeptide repeats
MRAFPWLPIGWVGLGLGFVVFALAWLAPTRSAPARRQVGSFRLSAAFLIALGALGLVTGLLLADGSTDEADALRTGGLAGAAVVALYGLWLNDRRQRTGEGQHELDRERAADERFAKSVELLGHNADQVRVGAMHALAGLARTRSGYTQTVLDVLCAYLRRPFDGEDANERQARLTAQRLLTDLLPAREAPAAARYDLDLTGARLEYLDLAHRDLGELRLRYASVHNSVNFSDTVFHRDVWLTGTTFTLVEHGNRFRCVDTVFHGKAWFSKLRTSMPADFTGTTFLGATKFADAVFEKPVTLTDARFAQAPDFAHTTFQAGKPPVPSGNPRVEPHSVEQGGQGALPG